MQDTFQTTIQILCRLAEFGDHTFSGSRKIAASAEDTLVPPNPPIA